MPRDIRTETEDKDLGLKALSNVQRLDTYWGSRQWRERSVGRHGKAYLSSLLLNKVKEKNH